MEYNWRDVALYALAVGAGRNDLMYTYEKYLKALPTYGSIPYWGTVNVLPYQWMPLPASMLAAGYDGAAVTKVRERNRIIAGTKSDLINYNDSQINEYLQFGDTRKLDFAITAPSRRFAILNYGTPCLYQPAKICRIINIGDEGLGA